MEESESSFMSSPKKMLGRLRDAASLAIQVTTGKKINLDKPNTSSNIITGFGYSILDIFENQFVDMSTIVHSKEDKIVEARSPFASPKKRRLNGSVSKDEAKRMRKELKQRELEDYERREQLAPKQYSLVKIKTSVGRYPSINYISLFTADEIHEAKKCLLNLLKRPIGTYAPGSPYASPDKKRGKQGGAFALNIQTASQESPDRHPAAVAEDDAGKRELADPKTRAPGGVWVEAGDFPHSFTNFIVYHNTAKMSHVTSHTDKWIDHATPYICNEKDVVIRLEVDEDAYKLQLAEATSGQRNGDSFQLPGYQEARAPDLDQVLIAYSPHPTNKTHEVLPRYLMSITQLENEGDFVNEDCAIHQYQQGQLVNLTFKSYFEGKVITFLGTP